MTKRLFEHDTGVGHGQTVNISFYQTNSDLRMCGKFLVYPFYEKRPGVHLIKQHKVCIETYFPMEPSTGKTGNEKFICVAGQSLNCKSGEWIEYVPPSGGTVTVNEKTTRGVSLAVMD